MSVLRKLDRCLERFLSIMDGIAAISDYSGRSKPIDIK